jgi:hypothetical protein
MIDILKHQNKNAEKPPPPPPPMPNIGLPETEGSLWPWRSKYRRQKKSRSR